MSAGLLLFGAFAFPASFNAGSMLTLQIQHYGIYSLVGRDGFGAYIRANNRAAVIPVILPAQLLLLASLGLVLAPCVLTRERALVALGLNIVQLISTFIWQRRLQGQMAEVGYDDAKVRRLVATNWIRTGAFLIQALLATGVVVQALAHRT